MATADHDYVLGTHDEELDRLGLQHELWRPRVLTLWRDAALSAGQTVMDLGCGPGFASLDLADVVGASGQVVSIDRSERFLAALAANAGARNLRQIQPALMDLNGALSWPVNQVDAIWARWSLSFLNEPRRVLAEAAQLIRPGGRFVIQEYLAYELWQFIPHSPRFETFVAGVMRAWRDAGGEPNLGPSLVAWLQEEGFTIDICRPVVEVVTVADPLWQWPRAFVDTGARRLAEIGLVTAIEAEGIWTDFLARETTPGTLMVTPMVLQIVARK